MYSVYVCRFSSSSWSPLLGLALPEPGVTVSRHPVHLRTPLSGRRGFRYGNMLAMNPVVALWMEQDAVVCTRRTTQGTGDAVMKAPTRCAALDLGKAQEQLYSCGLMV